MIDPTLKVVMFPVGEPARLMEIPHDLLSMRGLIATAQSGDDPTLQFITLGRPHASRGGTEKMRNLQLICDDNANMYKEPPPPNRQIGPTTVIRGPFFITAIDATGPEDMDNVSLTDEEAAFVLRLPWRVL